MELLLNLAWMLLALPAFWLWQRDAGLRTARKVSSAQCLLTLACGLVLLFPVISASDDLHAMRTEMEESSASKRAVRQAASDRHSAWVNRLQVPAVVVAGAVWFDAPEIEQLKRFIGRVSPLAGSDIFYGGRAPPFSLLV
jgi:hypothetical protein